MSSDPDASKAARSTFRFARVLRPDADVSEATDGTRLARLYLARD
jgi:hypothetical protein